MNGTKLIWSNMAQVMNDLKKVDANRVKSAQTALKVEGYRLRGQLYGEVREGRPGGRKLAALSIIARYTKTGKLRKLARKPLAPLARLIRYRVSKSGNFSVEVGFVSPTVETRGWKRLIGVLQEGGSRPGSGSREDLGKRLAITGGKLKKKGNKAAAKFFFLKKGQTPKNVPARNTIDPFWNKNQAQARSNIIKNWEAKMKGERI